jgi:hypothetical protein
MSDQPQSEPGAQDNINTPRSENEDGASRRAACPMCGGALIEIRGKLQCSVCHTICETCCEGGPT